MRIPITILSIFLCALSYAQTDSPQQRISRNTLIIQTNPDSIGALIERARAYNELKEFDLAIADCSLALQKNPKRIDAYKVRGSAYYNKKIYDTALLDLSRFLEHEKKDATAWNFRGNTYYYLNRLDEAVSDYSNALQLEPGYAMAWFNRGDAYYWKEKYDLAIGDISESLRIDPTFLRAWYIRGMCYYYQDKLEPAIADLTKAHELDPTNADILNSRGLSYFYQKNTEKAIADFTLAIINNPRHLYSWINRGNVYKREGKNDLAIADYTQALLYDSKNGDALYSLGNIYYLQKKYQDALKYADELLKIEYNAFDAFLLRADTKYELKQYSEALDDYKQCLKLNPKHIEALNSSASCYKKLGRHNEALKAYAEALAIDPKSVYTLNNRGNYYTDIGKFDEAIADYNAVLNIDPKNYEARNNRGNIFYYQEKYDLSISDYTIALLLDPKRSNAAFNRANAYKHVGRYAEAIKEYSAIIVSDPANTLVWRERAQCYLSQMKFDSAIADYNEALKYDANDTAAYVNRGLAFHSIMKFDRAVIDYTEALKLHPANVTARINRGITYDTLGKYDLALKDFNEVLKVHPKNTAALDSRGNLYMKLTKNDLALKDYNEALKIEPDFVNALTNRGNLLLYMGDFEGSLNDYRKILALNPGNKVAAYNIGSAYASKYTYDSAAYYSNLALKIDPDYPQALNIRGYSTFSMNAEQGMADVNRAIQLKKNFWEAYNYKGMMHAWLGNYDSAIYFYNRALNFRKDEPGILNNRALIYHNQNLLELAQKDYLRALAVDPSNARIYINLILTYIAGDDLAKAAQLYDEYRKKKLSGYMEAYKAFNFLSKYITACTDYVRVKNYKQALPMLIASIEEYKESNQDDATNKMLAYEYTNVMYRTGRVLEELTEYERALDYYKKAQILNPGIKGIAKNIEDAESKRKDLSSRTQTPAQLQLLTPILVAGNTVQKDNTATDGIFVSGIAKDPSGISWVKVNGTDVTTIKDDGYFSANIKSGAQNLVVQTANKRGQVTTNTYQWQQQPGASSADELNIQPIPVDQKPVFHAVLIANSNYSGKWSKLPTTIAEAQLYKKLLTTLYGFDEANIVELYDKGYVEMLSGLSSKLESLTEHDNLIILYAGHGTYKKAGTELIGYWVPLNANAPEIDYISNKKLDEIISGCQAKHILMISDACYSAAMRGGGDDDNMVPEKYEYKFRSRQMLTSGGLEKVPGESIFIKMVMKALEQNDEQYLSAKVLYNLIFSGVRNQTNKEPELNLFGKDGNEGGQFYFIRAK